jgi:hypothetical protein
MASPWLLIAEGLGARVDEDLLPTLYGAASVSTAQVRDELRRAGLSFRDAEAGGVPSPEELSRATRYVVKRSAGHAALFGTASGVGGVYSVPPEAIATLVFSLRLGQRLAVVHGFDPETDLGRLLLLRAMAAAHDIRLPESARVSMRVSELPQLARESVIGPSAVGDWLARRMAAGTASSVVGRMVRLVPGLGATLSGLSAWRRSQRLAVAMCGVYRRAMEAEAFVVGDVVLAEEIAPRA